MYELIICKTHGHSVQVLPCGAGQCDGEGRSLLAAVGMPTDEDVLCGSHISTHLFDS